MTPKALAALHATAFSTDRAWSADEFRALLDSPHCHLSAATHGFALWRAVAGEAELLTIATHPDHRRQGIARALMQDWMRSASALAETAFLELAADNAGAAALYAQFGFECVAQRPNYYVRPDHRIDALILRAPLPFSD